MNTLYKNKLHLAKDYMFHFLGYVEYIVALTIIAGIVVALLKLPHELGILQLEFDTVGLRHFLEYVANIIIAVELIFVLMHQTPSAVVEILSLAITREIVLQELHMFEILLGVIAIAILFGVRKHLFVEKTVQQTSLNMERDLIEEEMDEKVGMKKKAAEENDTEPKDEGEA